MLLPRCVRDAYSKVCVRRPWGCRSSVSDLFRHGSLRCPARLERSSWPSRAAVTRRRRSPPTASSSPSRGAALWRAARRMSFWPSAVTAARTFGAPVRVNDIDGDARVNGEQPPHVALVRRAGREPAIVVVWTTKGANGTTLLQSRSDDGGRSFAPAVLVPGTDAAGQSRLASDRRRTGRPRGRGLARSPRARARPDDGRVAPRSQPSQAPDAKPDGVAMAQKSKLYFASLDGAAAPRAVTGGVCYCCKTALVSAGGGRSTPPGAMSIPGTFATWRSRCRATAAARSRAPVRVSEDKWALEGCPDDGPAMAVDAQNRIHIVWPTLVGGATAGRRPERSRSSTRCRRDGRPFTPRERIPTEGLPHHPRIAARRGRLADGRLGRARRRIEADRDRTRNGR